MNTENKSIKIATGGLWDNVNDRYWHLELNKVLTREFSYKDEAELEKIVENLESIEKQEKFCPHCVYIGCEIEKQYQRYTLSWIMPISVDAPSPEDYAYAQVCFRCIQDAVSIHTTGGKEQTESNQQTFNPNISIIPKPVDLKKHNDLIQELELRREMFKLEGHKYPENWLQMEFQTLCSNYLMET